MGKDQKLELISMSCKEITNEYYKSFFEFTKIAQFSYVINLFDFELYDFENLFLKVSVLFYERQS